MRLSCLVTDYIDGETLDDYLAEHTGTMDGSFVMNAPAARSTSRTGGSPVLSGLPESEVIRLLKPIAAAPMALRPLKEADKNDLRHHQ